MAAEGLASITQYLTFRLGDEVFALDISTVREVLDFTSVTKVPRTPASMRGVINLRGTVVPVIDLRIKFGMTAAERTVNTCVIITETLIDGEMTVLGALVDSVQEVLDLGADAVLPPPRIGTGLRREGISGMAGQNDRFVIILDIEQVFSADPIALLQTGQAAQNETSLTV